MKYINLIPITARIRLLLSVWILLICFVFITSCSYSEKVVEKTGKTVKKTTRNIARGFYLPDEDLKRKVGIFDFENKSLRDSHDFQKVFHKGLPEYMNSECQGIIVAEKDTGGNLNPFKKPPKSKSGAIDNFALAIIGRQFGLNAMVTGNLEDIRIVDELKGVLWTKDTHHFVDVFVRVEVYDTRTATKILDETFNRRIEIEDLEYQLIRDSEKLNLPELNETLNKLLTDIGESICYIVTEQPWNGYITKIDGDKYIVSSGSRIGLQLGNILEVYDSSRIIEGVGDQRFFTPGLKTGEIEVVAITEDGLEATLIKGKDIKQGSTVMRK